MARVFQEGFEFNSVTANPANWTSIAGSPTLSTTTVRSGTYAGQITSLVSATAKGWVKKWLGTTAAGPFWGRAYLNVATRPSASNHIMSFNSASGTPGNSEKCKITLEADGTLILRHADGTAIGSASAVLALNTWYQVELKMDATGAGATDILEARLDGTIFATSSVQTLTNAFAFSVGGNLDLEAQTTGDWFFDDIAVNDNTGSFQTAYPGSGKIIQLRPNATGDVNAWLNTAGGAGDANNYTLVDEVTPDNATTRVQSGLLNSEDLYNCDASGIGASDTVNVVAIGGRFRNDVADTLTAFKFEVEKTSGGTKTQSAAIIPNTISWNTNATAEPRNFPIVTYQDPDSASWTQSTLDTMQIGVTDSAININKIQLTTVWASVDYTPAVAGTSSLLSLSGIISGHGFIPTFRDF